MADIEFNSKKFGKHIRLLLEKKENEPITEEDLEKIRILRVDKNIYGDFSMRDLVLFKNLNNLSLSNIEFGDIEAKIIESISSIRILAINNSKVNLTEIRFGNLNLESLFFVGCEGVDVSKIGQSKSINKLSIINCNYANLEGIEQLKNLEELNLPNNEWIQDTDLEGVWKNKNIRRLNLDGNQNISKQEREGIEISQNDEFLPTEKKDWNTSNKKDKRDEGEER